MMLTTSGAWKMCPKSKHTIDIEHNNIQLYIYILTECTIKNILEKY